MSKQDLECTLSNEELNRAKRLGSNWKKQISVIQKLHQRIRNRRNDFLQKTSTEIVLANQLIVVEDLNVAAMVRSNLSLQISDSGWGYFRQMLKYKCDLYRREYLEVNAAYSSQECFMCGHTDKGNRKTQSEFKCLQCGHENHADHNAAQNILRRGQRLLAQSTDNCLRLAKVPDIQDVSLPLQENKSLK